MNIQSKFPGACSLCGAEWAAGETIDYRRNCSPICVTCSSAGRTPPAKDAAPSKKPANASPASVPADSDVRALTEVALRIEKVLTQILTELRAARPPVQTQNAPSPEAPSTDSEVPF